MNTPSDPTLSAVERYKEYLPAEDYARLLEVINQPAESAVRVNLLMNPSAPAFCADSASMASASVMSLSTAGVISWFFFMAFRLPAFSPCA